MSSRLETDRRIEENQKKADPRVEVKLVSQSVGIPVSETKVSGGVVRLPFVPQLLAFHF
jgi:hypothetical protein